MFLVHGKFPVQFLLPLALCCLLVSPWARADLQGELLATVEHLFLDGDGQLSDGGTIYQPALIAKIYANGDYQPTWKDRDQAEEVLAILKGSHLDGLSPGDYHYGELMALWEERDTVFEDLDRRRARFDVLLTDGLLLYVRHLYEGKADPQQLDPSFNYSRRDFDPEEVAVNLRNTIAESSVHQVVDSARPDSAFYVQMRAALAYYRDLADRVAFRPLPGSPILKPGQSHANVSLLRKRLEDVGYLAGASERSDYYDATLATAMKQFQHDHGLDVDGIVGAQSFLQLNMSYEARVDSLRINMDRLRWVTQDISDDFIAVNVAGFELYYMRNDELVWETPVMTGTIEHQTPVFTEKLKYLEFNPTWTVPRSIIARSLFPKFKANPQYAVDNNYDLIDRKGNRADPHAINWAGHTPDNFPYSVVQQPGENNALGRVKFIFPNRYAVYLHDTPSRALFSRSARAFSSGCVRVKNPLEFAQVLLDDPQNWSLEQVEALVASRKPQQRIFMKRDVDIMLMYWTTSPTRGGKLQFHPDIYGKDPAALSALNASPRVIGFAGA